MKIRVKKSYKLYYEVLIKHLKYCDIKKEKLK